MGTILVKILFNKEKKKLKNRWLQIDEKKNWKFIFFAASSHFFPHKTAFCEDI